jgi:hypothetical protein
MTSWQILRAANQSPILFDNLALLIRWAQTVASPAVLFIEAVLLL